MNQTPTMIMTMPTIRITPTFSPKNITEQATTETKLKAVIGRA
jgi:hypothetical protein